MRIDLPLTIPYAVVEYVLATLGISPEHVRSVLIEPDRISVDQYRTDDQGRRYFAAGNDAATVTTTIGIERKAQA